MSARPTAAKDGPMSPQDLGVDAQTVTVPKRQRGRFSRFVLRGLAVLLPSILTVWILWMASVFVYKNVAEPINRAIKRGVVYTMPVLPESVHPAWYAVTPEALADAKAGRTEGGSLKGLPDRAASTELRVRAFSKVWRQAWYLQATGLLVAIVLLYIAGALVGGLIGRKVYQRLERVISRVPGFKQVYPHVKQLVELLIGERPLAFKRVVLIQFPRQGQWVIAFVTGPAMTVASKAIGQPSVTVFVPNTPTPFTGFTLTVPEADVVDVPLSLDEALRFVITGGVLVPERLLPDGNGASPLPAAERSGR